MGKAISGHVLAAIHLAFWSQLGVLVRIYLDLFFTNRCSGGWGVCLLSKGKESLAQHQFCARIVLNKTRHAYTVHQWQDSDVALLTSGERHGELGSYFVDLASNMLGSFVMGLLTATSALDATASKSLAVLPESHVWQVIRNQQC